MITKIVIENFRSIRALEFEPKNLCALVGENNVGKSNILSAIDLLLGERWPANRISIDDVCNRDKSLDLQIKVFVDQPIHHSYYGFDVEISGFDLKYNYNEGVMLRCLDEHGNFVQTQYNKDIALNNTIREQVPCVLIGVNRNLERELSGSQWTLFGRLLKEIEKEFIADDTRKNEYQSKMKDVSNLLRISSFAELEGILREQVKKLTGFVDADLRFIEPKVLEQYKSLDLTVRESSNFDECSALDMGAGIQSAIVIALIQAYRQLKKRGAILLIEEPEVYLHPHARRYFYVLLKELAEQGNQIFYATHSTEFVALPDYEALCLVRKTASAGTAVMQAKNLAIAPSSREELKLLTQFDARRNEIFFARKVLLVEGPTERFSLPYMFELMDIDINVAGISIADAGGKENLEFFIKILEGFSIPFVVLHDEDRNANNYETYHNDLNARIQNTVGDQSLVFRMDPDFEGIFGLIGKKEMRHAIEAVKNLAKENIPSVVNDAIDKLINL
jgi:predicted ATP-dependent endonuclease of OLD family